MNTPSTIETPALKRALQLINSGYAIIPAGSGPSGKAPLLPAWQQFMPIQKNGEAGRIPSVAEAQQWWSEHPEGKLAIIGGWKGLGVLDIDDKALADTLAEQFKDHAPLVRTPRGGLHIYFQEEEPSNSGPLISGVVDVKAMGGYFLAPPSPGYEKINDIRQPLPVPNIREYASILLTGLGYTPDKNRQSISAGNEISKIAEGSRNEMLTSFAGSLRHNKNGLGEEGLFAALSAINQAQCIPPLRDQEVRSIAKSVNRYAPTDNTWQPITTFNQYNLPPFPIQALPENLQQWVMGEAEATQTSPDLAAFLALAAIAAACQRKIEICVKENYSEPLSVYIIIALEPGNRKSAVFRHATKPIYEYETSQAQALKDAVAASQSEYEVWRKRVKHAQDDAAKAIPEEYEEKMKLAKELAVEFSKMKPLVPPRYVVDDATTEKIVSLLCEHGERIAMMSADSDIFAVMAGRYSAKGEPNFAIYLKAHVGDSHRVDRINGNGGILERPALTLALTVQPSVLREINKTSQFTDRGLVARILFSIPVSLVGQRKTRTIPVADMATFAYERLITNLLSIPPQLDDRYKTVAYQIRLSPEALELFESYATTLEPKLAPYGAHHDIVNWAAKLAGSVIRIAGLLHLADHHTSARPWEIPLPPETLQRAIEIGDYLVEHARCAHGFMKSDPQVENAQYLLGWIKKIGTPSFTKRDLYRHARGKLQKMGDMEPPLALLIQHGYLRERPPENKSGAGRNPSPVLEVHPDYLASGQNGHNGQNTSPLFSLQEPPVHSGHSSHDIPHQPENNQLTNPRLFEDVVEVFGDKIEATQIKQEASFPDFPLYGQQHQHEYTATAGSNPGLKRCRHCGEFAPTEKGK